MIPRVFPLVCTLAALSAPLAAGAADRSLAVDFGQSRIEVAVKATVDSFTGKLAQYEPAIAVDDAGQVVSARLAFHFRDVLTGKDGRDKAMHKWQETEKFPDAVFQLAALTPPAGSGGAATAVGRLTLHGVTREIRFPASVIRDGDVYSIDGDAPVDVREFGLPIIRMLGLLKVDPVVHVRFHLQGRAGR